MNILEGAYEVTYQPRARSRDIASWLADRITRVEIDAGFPLVEGEEGPAHVGLALGRLVSGRTNREGGGPICEMEAWLQAEVVAATVAAAHELETGDIVTATQEGQLRDSLATFGIQFR